MQKIIRERSVADALRCADRDATVETLKAEVERATESEKKMKLLLNVHQNIDKDRRDRVQLANSLQKVKDELAALKAQVSSPITHPSHIHPSPSYAHPSPIQLTQVARGEVGGGVAASQGARIAALEKDLEDEKASVETLLHEIETTGQSLDEAQEQTQRLLRELNDKADHGFEHAKAQMRAEAAAALVGDELKLAREAQEKLEAELTAKNKCVCCLLVCMYWGGGVMFV